MHAILILEKLVQGFSQKKDQPEPLLSAIAATRGELLHLITDLNQNAMLIDDIEERLVAISAKLETSMIVSVPENERSTMIQNIKVEYKNRTLNDASRAAILMNKLYQKFGLPKLTLFEL